MGRTKIFEETDALDKAMRLFWRQGYANTSIKQLLTEMDMLNGSFYHCFKDKKTVYLKSLEHYNKEITSKRLTALASDDNFSVGIRAMFTEIFKTLKSKDEPNGCLFVNSIEEEVLCDDEIKTILLHDADKFIQFLADRLQLSNKLKHTSTNIPESQIALILVTYIFGLFRISNMPVDIKQLKDQTENFLTALNL